LNESKIFDNFRVGLANIDDEAEEVFAEFREDVSDVKTLKNCLL
jgi:uncharacterized protein (UPF0335 family)